MRNLDEIKADLDSGKPLSSEDYQELAKATRRTEQDVLKKADLAKASEMSAQIRTAFAKAGVKTSVPVLMVLDPNGEAHAFAGYRKGDSYHFDMTNTGKGTTGVAFSTVRKVMVAAYTPATR